MAGRKVVDERIREEAANRRSDLEQWFAEEITP